MEEVCIFQAPTSRPCGSDDDAILKIEDTKNVTENEKENQYALLLQIYCISFLFKHRWV